MTDQPSRREFVGAVAAAAAALAAFPLLPRSAQAFVARRRITFAARPFDLHRVRLLPGIFRDDVEVNRRYMMALDPDRLLHSFRITAGLPSTAEPYYGWEAPNNELRGHFVGHYLSGCALLAAQLDDDAVKARGTLMVAELARCQAASGYLSAFPVELVDRLKARRGVWAPFYTIHKILAGMLDCYSLTGNAQALAVARGIGRWTRDWVAPVDDPTMQRILNTEFGGMGESLRQLSVVTGETSFLDVAHRFDHERVLAPLAEGRDALKGVHANTTIPKIIAAARLYEVNGDQRSHDIADYFWHEVTSKRCFATGGSSSGEGWPSEAGMLAKELAPDTEESCVTYNMLKLTRQLFSWTADPAMADYYERALFNGMLGTQHPADGEKIYYTPLQSGYWRMFGTPDHGFWCCHGSGVESHSKLGDSIYFHDDEGVYVNLFVASEVDWGEKGVKLVQDTTFPTSDTTRITLRMAQPTRVKLRLRIPYWVAGAPAAKVNGKRIATTSAPSSYLVVDREWRDGAQVALTLPMALHVHAMPDDPTLQAVMYGPLVLAGKLAPEPTRAGPTPPRMSPDFTVPPLPVAAIVAPSADVTSWVKPVRGQKLEFTTIGQATNIPLAPFHAVYDERYVVYWKVGLAG